MRSEPEGGVRMIDVHLLEGSEGSPEVVPCCAPSCLLKLNVCHRCTPAGSINLLDSAHCPQVTHDLSGFSLELTTLRISFETAWDCQS